MCCTSEELFLFLHLNDHVGMKCRMNSFVSGWIGWWATLAEWVASLAFCGGLAKVSPSQRGSPTRRPRDIGFLRRRKMYVGVFFTVHRVIFLLFSPSLWPRAAGRSIDCLLSCASCSQRRSVQYVCCALPVPSTISPGQSQTTVRTRQKNGA